MIVMRPVLIRPGIIDSERVCRLPVTAQLFFRNLLHACDGRGYFPADVDELRCAFYRRAPAVTNPHVEVWLTKCHQAGLVKLYTRGGKGFGEIINYGQRDSKRGQLYPAPDEGEPELFTTAPPVADPPKQAPELKRRKSPHSPPPAGGGDRSALNSQTAEPLKARTAPARFRRAERMDTLHEEKERLENEMREILRPGGCAYNVTPTPEKAARLEALRWSHGEVAKMIERRRSELTREMAAT